MYQVAQGMAYLESNRVVHGYLTVNNILLVTEQHAKISNFSRSEVLIYDTQHGKRFILTDCKHRKMWLAPEHSQMSDISFKSDVWSYGMALWRAMSNGNKLWENRSEVEIEKIMSGEFFLERPRTCHDNVYSMMKNCWQQEPEKRPTFKILVSVHERIICKEMKIEKNLVVAKNKRISCIDQSDLSLLNSLSDGYFGRLCKGQFKHNHVTIPVIAKTVEESTQLSSALISFTHELQLVSQLRCSYIAQFIGLCTGTNFVALVLKLPHMGPLDKFISLQRDIQNSTLVQFMLQVAKGIAYLHKHRVAHLNIKASSIYLMSEQHVQITDFRRSKQLSDDEPYHYVTYELDNIAVRCSAPEVLASNRGYLESDVWSYGVTLWEVLSQGAIPFEKDSHIEVCEFIKDNYCLFELPKPSNSSYELYNLMSNCWQREPNLRPPIDEIVHTVENDLQKQFNINSDDLQDLTSIFSDGIFVSERIYKFNKRRIVTTVRHLQPTKFEKNVSFLLQLNHVHTSKFVGFCNWGELIFVFFEFAGWGNLHERLNANPLIPVDNLIRIVYHISLGMSYLENKRILHLNLRAKNIFLVSPYHAKVSNFESSKTLAQDSNQCYFEDIHGFADEDKTRFPWAAPECMKLNIAYLKSDVWSFGVFDVGGHVSRCPAIWKQRTG